MANDTAKRLLTRVKALREALGLSQEEFAEHAGLKYKHYQAIEAGRKIDIRFSTLEKLAKACGLELWELLDFDSNSMAVAEPADDPKLGTNLRKKMRKPAKRATGKKNA
ncbi:MAG TPA: helix-turn-helix transcriptional regulator [Opitutaceae bacterium]|nr:helix-turn-helix transcriptional regulator [Opitutaceae bacterium]